MTGTRVPPTEITGLYGGLPPLAAPAPAGVASQA